MLVPAAARPARGTAGATTERPPQLGRDPARDVARRHLQVHAGQGGGASSPAISRPGPGWGPWTPRK
eukprot:10718389-Lingulodinium_polyedra.AAC.1